MESSNGDKGPDNVLSDGAYGVFEGAVEDRVVMDEYRRLGTWAPELVSLLTRLFAGGSGTLIDVGANIGLVSIPVLERSTALGIAFEPEPRNFGLLSRNLARHGLERRIECHELACHSTAGRLPLALSPDNLGDHRLQRGAPGRDRRIIQVGTQRLDALLRGRDLERPVVIKVDVQGSEVGVFEGAPETLARTDYLVTEYWPEGIVAHGDSAQRFADIMRGFQFGAVLHVLPLPQPLNTAQYVFEQLSWIANDGSDPGFFDLLFSRHMILPTFQC